MNFASTLAPARREPVGGSVVGIYAWSILGGLCVPLLVAIVGLIADLVDRQTLPPSPVRLGRWLFVPIGNLARDHGPITQLSVLVGVGLVVALIFSLAVWRCRVAADRRARSVTRHLHDRMLGQSLHRAEFEGAASQRVRAMQLIHHDLPSLQTGLSAWYRIIPRGVITVAACIGLALLIDVWLTVVSVTIGWLLWRGRLYLRKLQDDAVTAWEVPRHRDRLAKQIGDAPLLARLQSESAGDRSFETETASLYRRLERRDRQQARTWPLVFAAIATASAIVLLGIGTNSLGIVDPISLPGAITLVCGIAAAAAAAIRLSEQSRRMPDAAESMDNVYQYLAPIRNSVLSEQRVGIPGVRHGVSFAGVTLLDSSGNAVVKNLSLSIKPGEVVCLIGTSAISTRAVAELLMGFGRPREGDVEIEQISLGDIHPRSLASHVMWIEPPGPIWSGTVLENVRGDDDAISPAVIADVLKELNIYEQLHRLPEGLSTVLSATEHSLNEEATYGIGVARAAVHRPPILIVDESPAGTDGDDDPSLAVMRKMAEQGTTIVVLPRRLSTLRQADRVILMAGSKFAGEGTHQELLSGSDLYRHLNYQLFNPYRK